MNTGPIQPPQGSNPHSPMNSERDQPSQDHKVRPLPYHVNRPSMRSGAFQPPPYRPQPQQDGLRFWFKKQTPRFLLGCECILGALFICSFCLLAACGSIAPAAAPSICQVLHNEIVSDNAQIQKLQRQHASPGQIMAVQQNLASLQGQAK
jgi:hypothetical protein